MKTALHAVLLLAFALPALSQSYYGMTGADFLRGGTTRSSAQQGSYYNQTGADFLRGGSRLTANSIMIQNPVSGTVQFDMKFGNGKWKRYNLGAKMQQVYSGYGTASVRFSNMGGRIVTYDLRKNSINAFGYRGRALDLLANGQLN